MAKQAKTLTQRELQSVLNYIRTQRHSERNRCMLLLTYYAGLRVGEVATLKVADVYDINTHHVFPELTLRAQHTKGGTARQVYLNQKLRRELRAYLATTQSLDPQRALFPTQKQGQRGFTPNTLAQFFCRLYQAAGIQGASSHSGRRTFITRLAESGVSVRVLAALAGHQSIQTTQAYIDVNDDIKRRAVELL